MKTKIIIIIIAALCSILLPVMNALAADNKIEGEIGATGTIVDVNGNKWKFNEYRELKGGVYGNVRLGFDNGAYFMRFKGSDFGYDTQNYRLDGGMWGKFKYDLYYREIPHNYTFDAKTFYSGVGTNNLTIAPGVTPSNAGTWPSTFDYSVKRKQYGAAVDLGLLKPFYVDFSASREDRSGIKPKSAHTNQTSAFVELPEPVDYTTDTFKAEVGYATKPLFASFSYYYNKFDNADTNLSFVNPNGGGPDITTLPPDNDYYRLAFKGAVQLPMNSRFNVTLATARAESSSNLFNSYLFPGDAARTAITYAGGASVFNGKIETQNAAFVLSSNPVSFLDGKIFYKYYNKKNKSDQIVITSAGNVENELFDYHKNNVGVELGFKLPAHFYLQTAYNYLKVDRDRIDIPETEDNIYSAELRWSGLDFMAAKVGYERLERDAEHRPFDTAIFHGFAVEFNELYLRRFDVWKKHHDSYKASLEFYPLDNLSFALGYRNTDTKYEDVPMGLRSDKRELYSVDADYAFGKVARVGAYTEYEKIKAHSLLRNGTNNATDINPGNAPTTTNFNYTVTQHDKSFNYGANTDIYIVPKKLTLRLQYDYLMSNGLADLTYLGVDPAAAATAVPGRTNDNMDSTNWDDYRKSAFLVKAVYDFTRSFSVGGGVAFERYKYSDDALNNYPASYTSGTGANTTYLTGLYKEPSYNASVVFATVAYKF